MSILVRFKTEWPHLTVKEHFDGKPIGLIVPHPKTKQFSPNVWKSFSSLTWLMIVLCLIATLCLKTMIYMCYKNMCKASGMENAFMNVIFYNLFSFTEPIRLWWFQRDTVGQI